MGAREGWKLAFARHQAIAHCYYAFILQHVELAVADWHPHKLIRRCNVLSPTRRQTNIWTNARLLCIGKIENKFQKRQNDDNASSPARIAGLF